MDKEGKKIEVLEEEMITTSRDPLVFPDTREKDEDDEKFVESLERESLRNKFLHTEMVEVENGLTKPYVLLEENSFYPVFNPEKTDDPFISFEDYLRRSVGEGVYQNVKFLKPSITEVGTLLGSYEIMVNTIMDFSTGERIALEKIDQSLVFFFKDRINHFIETMPQRIHNSAVIAIGTHNKTALVETEARLALKIPNDFLQEKKEELAKILDDNLEKGENKAYKFKAYKLQQICREIFDRVDDVLRTPIYSDPLTPDNYEVKVF